MQCSKCNISNESDSFYCHNCGSKLKTQIDGWFIFFIFLFLIMSILAICFYIESESQLNKNYQLRSENEQLKAEKKILSDETQSRILNLSAENNRQESEIVYKDYEISNLKAQLPQKYKTLYANQYLYKKCSGKYEKTTCYFPSKGSTVVIYKQEDDYGLTGIGGWIPISRLEKY